MQFPTRTGPLVNDAAPFSVEMVAGSAPVRNRVRLAPQIGLPTGDLSNAPFAFEMLIGEQPSRSRVRLGPRIGQPILDNPVATFSHEMVIGWQPLRGLRFRFQQGFQGSPPDVAVFSIEMVTGYQPSTHRIRLGPRIGLPISQTTHVSAPFSVEMIQGSRPPTSRVKLAIRIGLPIYQTAGVTPAPPAPASSVPIGPVFIAAPRFDSIRAGDGVATEDGIRLLWELVNNNQAQISRNLQNLNSSNLKTGTLMYMADSATMTIANPTQMGFVFISDHSGGADFGALIAWTGTATAIAYQTGSRYSVTANNGGTNNVYASGGLLTLQNKTGTTNQYTICYIGN